MSIVIRGTRAESHHLSLHFSGVHRRVVGSVLPTVVQSLTTLSIDRVMLYVPDMYCQYRKTIPAVEQKQTKSRRYFFNNNVKRCWWFEVDNDNSAIPISIRMDSASKKLDANFSIVLFYMILFRNTEGIKRNYR